MSNEPIWEDGYPQNLEAAALDALVWLKAFRARLGAMPERIFWNDRDRLDGCIAAVEQMLDVPALTADVLVAGAVDREQTKGEG